MVNDRHTYIAVMTLVLLCAGPRSRAETAEWVHDDALCRLRVSVANTRGEQLRVDLPEHLRSQVKGVAAYHHDGSRLAASVLVGADQAYAVWVAVGRTDKKLIGFSRDGMPLPVTLYLFSEDRTPVPMARTTRRPARFLRTTQSLLTRPFTGREALLLMHDVLGAERGVSAFDVDGVGNTVDRPNWRQPPERRSAVMLWSSGWWAEKEMTVTFGGDQAHVAWFVFVNGRAVADWRSARREDGKLFGEPVTLPEGSHHLDFLVIQRHGEAIPTCLWRHPDGTAEPFVGEVPANHPEAVSLQGAPEQQPVSVAITRLERYFFEGVDTDLLTLHLSGADGNPLPAAADVSLFGAEVAGRGIVGQVISGPRLPGIMLTGMRPGEPPGDVRFPPRRLWLPARRLFAELRLGAMPMVCTHAGALSLSVDLTLSAAVDDTLVEQLAVDATQYAANGTMLQSETVMLGRLGRQTASVRLHADGDRVVFTTGVSQHRIAEDVVLRVLRPETLPAQLTAQDRALFVDGQRAVLVCRPLAALVPPSSGLAAAGRPRRLAFLDDFLAGAEAPGASLLPESCIGRSWREPPAVLRESVAPGGTDGVIAEAATFSALARLLAMEPDVIVLAVGASALRRGRPIESICEDLLFMAQAAVAAGARPMLVALPALPNVAAERSRRFALLCKELAWRLALPVLDAHSKDVSNQFGGLGFPDTFTIAAGRLPVSVPNNRGREWFCSLVENAVAEGSSAQGR